MSKHQNVEVGDFCFEANLLDFVLKDGYKLKGLMLSTDGGECYVKLAQHLRMAFNLQLPLGTRLQVMGTKQYCSKKNQITLKAQQVTIALANVCGVTHTPDLTTAPCAQRMLNKSSQVILICQKSDCVRRGSNLLCRIIEQELRVAEGGRSHRHLTDNVTIKSTGCMKNCKAGPNLIMPDKTRYSQVKPEQIPALVKKHFASYQ
jgi:NADH:ubiquinone oxidoreductase subunit E